MTEKEVLKEVFDDLMDKVFVRSDNYLMSKPKRGCENEFEHYREMADIVKAMLEREEATK